MAETLPLAVCDECGAIYPFAPRIERLPDGIERTFVACPTGHQVTISYTSQALRDEAARLAKRWARVTTQTGRQAQRRGLEKAAARFRHRFDAFNRQFGVVS